MGLVMAKTVLVSACLLRVCTGGEQCSKSLNPYRSNSDIWFIASKGP